MKVFGLTLNVLNFNLFWLRIFWISLEVTKDTSCSSLLPPSKIKIFYYSPIIFTSHSNFTLNLAYTFSTILLPRFSISVAEALPLFIKKFACLSLTYASPKLVPLHPASSISFAAWRFSGFLKVLPEVLFLLAEILNVYSLFY